MTNEPSNSDRDNDPLVTRTYRDAATERVPPELDRKVLNDARAATGGRYSRAITWLRPMAWAATIGLSLAIVIELSNIPQPEEAALRIPASSPAVTTPAAPADRGRAAKLASESVPESVEAPAYDRDFETLDKAKQDPEERPQDSLPQDANIDGVTEGRTERIEPIVESEADAAKRSDSTRKLETRAGDAKHSDVVPRPEVSADKRDAAADLDAFRVKDAPMMQEAEELARLRDGSNQEAAGAAAMSMTASVAKFCDDIVTVEPETWLECIQELEADGREDEAKLERERLEAAFPDFESP